MKKSTLLLFALFTMLFQINAQVAIGAGDLQGENAPFEPYFGYSYAQTVYLASEINASGNIIDIQWYYSGTTALPNSQDLTIYMAELPRTEFATTDDWEPIASFTQVYAGGITVTAGAEGWVTLTLDTPFTYSGSGNLVIAVKENADGFDTFGDDFYNSQVTTNRTISYFSDSINPDITSPPTASNIDDTIPNIILGGIVQACPTPTDLNVTGITSNEAELSWTENGTSSIWNIEIVETGTMPTGTPTAINVSNPYNATGLSAITGYDVYIQSDCGAELSAFAGPLSFSTLCDVFTPDYIETFTTIVPDCWNEASNGDATTGPLDLGAGEWSEDGFQNLGTTGAYKINLYNLGASDWIISPQFDLTGGPFQVEFDFGVMTYFSSTTTGTLGSDDTVQLLVSSDNGTTWTSLLTLDNTTVVPINGITPIVDLTAYSGQTVQFGILASEGTVDDPEDNDVFVDNFRVRNIPTCPEPTDLAATNLSLTSTEVSWVDASASSSWNIEYGESGFALGTGTIEAGVTTNPYTLTGLTADTSYEFYIQTICDATNISSYAGPFTFFTGYCESIPSSNDGDGVLNVTIGVTDFPSLGDVTYENQTSPVVNVFQGIETTLEVTFATGYTYDTNIWIDFNNDLVFDGSELVFQGESTNAVPTTLDASFIMPATAALGEHRMRIGTADGGQSTPNPCYNGFYGVTLDFTVNVEELTCTLAEADYTIITDCDNDEFSILVNVADFGDASSLELSNNVDTNTVQAFTTDTSYEYEVGPFPFPTTVKVFITNEQDNNCVISSDTYTVVACPPDNDEPCDATVAFVNDDFICVQSTPGTLLAASDSGIPAGSCDGNPDDDIWFQFVAQDEFQLISIANFPAFENIDHALYSGTCDALVELTCTSAEYSTITPSLTIGDTYFVRVFSGGSAPEAITFDLCITPYVAPVNVACNLAQNYCSGTASDILYTPNTTGMTNDMDIACLGDSPNPTYSVLQMGSSGDVLIEIVQNTAFDANDNPIGDELDVDFALWGPFDPSIDFCALNLEVDCPSCPSDNLPPNNDQFYPFGDIIDCSWSPLSTENITLTGAVEGEIYLLLVNNWVPDPNELEHGGVIQVRQTNIGESGSGSTVADIEAEIVSNEVVIDATNDPNEIDEVSVCGFTSVTLETNSPFADEFIWFEDGVVMTGETSSTLTVTESNNYQVQAFDNQCGSAALSQVVIINLYEDVGNVNDQDFIVCDGPVADGTEAFDLDAFSTSLGFGADFTVSYYTNTNDANQAISAVTSPYNSSGETLIMRVEDINAATNGFLGCRTLADLELIVNPRPVINQPVDFIVCDDIDGAVDGITEFNLTSINSEISTDSDITITYHASQDAADNNTDALTSPYSSGGETIYVRAENATTGCYETTTFNTEVNIVPLATFDPIYEYEVCPNATVPVDIGLIPSNFTADQVTVQWFVNDVLIPNQSGLILSSVLVQGDYRAEITFNDSGCINNAIATPVIELESCVIPGGISPNGDGSNENFDLSSYDVSRLEIFNRNGRLVYSKTNYTNEWVGQTNGGDELPVGTYFYTMIYDGGKKRSAWIYINK